MVKIINVREGSPAQKAGVAAGDMLISVNGKDINDVLDYRFYLAEEKAVIRTERNGVITEFSAEYPDDERLGLEFESPLMDEKRSCNNKCIFCFIDQLPAGMRETLYFKDDDSRLSFLQGNYITLTNLSREDVERITAMRFSPMRVSVHTTDPKLRCEMMNNRFAGKTLEYLYDFAKAGLKIHAQIVLCKGVNDGEALKKTLSDMYSFIPSLESLSVVPAGLTDHRQGLYPLQPFNAPEAAAVIDTVNSFGEKAKREYGSRVFWPADEFFIKAGRVIPEASYYEEFYQIENGVGMLSSFLSEIDEAIAGEPSLFRKKIFGKIPPFSLATGNAAYPYIYKAVEKISSLWYNKNKLQLDYKIYCIKNDFFGNEITVTGLLTGKDFENQLKGKALCGRLLIPANCLRRDEDIFLDDMTLKELEDKLETKIIPVRCTGRDFVRAVLGITEEGRV